MNKGLEALKKISNYPIGNFGILTIYCKFEEDFDLIKQDLERLEVLEKAIEILKEYPRCILDVLRFNHYFKYREMYDGVVELCKGDFDLLKEVLEND